MMDIDHAADAAPAQRFSDARRVDAIEAAAIALDGGPAQYAPLLRDLGRASWALLGSASHGTHEFYRERAHITGRLIVEHGFDAVAIEGDWPEAYRIDRYVRGLGDDAFATEALDGFKRFPCWLWRNADMVDFVDWLREYNAQRAPAHRFGFYGLDLYSLHGSMTAVLDYLRRADRSIHAKTRARYACFDQYSGDTDAYGWMAALGVSRRCNEEVLATLVELRQHAAHVQRDGSAEAIEAAFDAEQNARLVRNAERYYRAMAQRGASTWNMRDEHMFETLEALERHLHRRLGRTPKIVVWAHNAHLGDARATEAGRAQGELNLGQLLRQRHGDAVRQVGFTTYDGTVTAASGWGALAERKTVRPARADSHEALLHLTGIARFLLPLRGRGPAQRRVTAALAEPRLQRAIGVIYRPEAEHASHYARSWLPEQFDWLVHLDHTRALEPLERSARWAESDLPETHPTGL